MAVGTERVIEEGESLYRKQLWNLVTVCVCVCVYMQEKGRREPQVCTLREMDCDPLLLPGDGLWSV